MSEEAAVKRLNRAKSAAISILKSAYPEDELKIIPSDNKYFCFLGVRKKEIRMIRIVVDEITANDIKIIKDFAVPSGVCIKEIWCRGEGEKKFEMKEIE